MTPPPKVKLQSELVRSSPWASATNLERSVFTTLWGIADPPSCDEGGQVVLHCRVKTRTIAERVGRSERTVRRALAGLRRTGLIATETTGRYLAVALFPPGVDEILPLFPGWRPESEQHPIGYRSAPDPAPARCPGRAAKSDRAERSKVTGRLKGIDQGLRPAAGQPCRSLLAAAAAAAADPIAARLQRLGIGEPVRSQLARTPGVTLDVVERARRRWRHRGNSQHVDTGLLIVLLGDELDRELARRQRPPPKRPAVHDHPEPPEPGWVRAQAAAFRRRTSQPTGGHEP